MRFIICSVVKLMRYVRVVGWDRWVVVLCCISGICCWLIWLVCCCGWCGCRWWCLLMLCFSCMSVMVLFGVLSGWCCWSCLFMLVFC